MRDINRIKPLLSELESLWIKHPDMRLCQLIINLTRCNDPFYIEDDQLLEMIHDVKTNGF